MLEEGQIVRTTACIHDPIPSRGPLVERGERGTVVVTGKSVIHVRFKHVRIRFKNKESECPSHYWAYPPVSLLELVSLSSTLEGAEFTIEKDNGDGTYLVRKKQ